MVSRGFRVHRGEGQSPDGENDKRWRRFFHLNCVFMWTLCSQREP